MPLEALSRLEDRRAPTSPVDGEGMEERRPSPAEADSEAVEEASWTEATSALDEEGSEAVLEEGSPTAACLPRRPRSTSCPPVRHPSTTGARSGRQRTGARIAGAIAVDRLPSEQVLETTSTTDGRATTGVPAEGSTTIDRVSAEATRTGLILDEMWTDGVVVDGETEAGTGRGRAGEEIDGRPLLPATGGAGTSALALFDGGREVAVEVGARVERRGGKTAGGARKMAGSRCTQLKGGQSCPQMPKI